MNWKRILKFAIILVLATAVAAFSFGFAIGALFVLNQPIPAWIPIAQKFAVPITAMIVFIIFAQKQESRTWQHSLLVAFFAVIISFPLNLFIFGQYIFSGIKNMVVLIIMLSIGTLIGSYLRKKSLV